MSGFEATTSGFEAVHDILRAIGVLQDLRATSGFEAAHDILPHESEAFGYLGTNPLHAAWSPVVHAPGKLTHKLHFAVTR